MINLGAGISSKIPNGKAIPSVNLGTLDCPLLSLKIMV